MQMVIVFKVAAFDTVNMSLKAAFLQPQSVNVITPPISSTSDDTSIPDVKTQTSR